MDYSVDVNYEYQNVKSKLFRLSLLFSIILTLVIVGDVLLITLSKDNYLVQLIIAIVITTLFSYFAIFFFTNIYSEVNAEYRYYKGYASGMKPVEEVEFLGQGKDLCYVNGLYVYPVYVRYVSTLHNEDKIIYCLKTALNYEQGDKLTIETYQRIILKAERHQ